MAILDALVYDWSDGVKYRPTAQLFGLTESEIRIVKGEPAQMTTEAWGASRTANDEAP